MTRETGATERHVTYQGVDLAEVSSEEAGDILSNTVLSEFKTRLSRIGLEYQAPEGL